jgi:predicted O-methyltransferase YrrM
MSFSEDWFSKNIPTWTKELKYLKDKPINILEIGTFEGRSAIWMLENLLQHPDSKLYCVDNWLNQGDRNKKVYDTFIKNIEPWKSKVNILKGFSSDILRSLKEKDQFEFIYIDANKHSQNVLEDAVLSFPLLKKNGILIFDDYTHNKEHDVNCPRIGIDAFLNIYTNQIQVLHMKWQVILRKRQNPLSKKPCYSEYFKEPKKIPSILKQ